MGQADGGRGAGELSEDHQRANGSSDTGAEEEIGPDGKLLVRRAIGERVHSLLLENPVTLYESQLWHNNIICYNIYLSYHERGRA